MLGPVLLIIAAVWWLALTGLFLVSIWLRRNDIADVAWGIGVAGVGVASYLLLQNHTLPALIPVSLAGVWGLRLALRIGWRNLHKVEDPRYRVWRDTWGKWFYLRSYLQVYMLQGALMLVVGYVLVHAERYASTHTPPWLLAVGVGVWLVGFGFETVGDWQLDHFIAGRPAPGEVLTTGLWRYTRHPNYFGEIMMWWGIWLTIASVPYAAFALISPLTITFLIRYVSGVPLAEARLQENPAYRAYQARTSVLIPWPPRP